MQTPDFEACFPAVSFQESGSLEPPSRPMQWGLWSPKDRRWMQICQENYDANHGRQDADRPYQIPRKIHQIWLGRPLPEAFGRLQESWKAWHEGWELRLWTDSDVEQFGLQNKLAYDAAGNFGQQSDILRYEILLREGGLYVDLDFVCLGVFDGLHRRYDFYSGLSGTATFELNNGLIGCRPGHPIIRDIVSRIGETCTPRQPDSIGVPVSLSLPAMGAVAAAVAGGGGSGGGSRQRETVDPLAALTGGLGGLGGTRGEGLLADLLGGDDRASLKQAVEVEPGSATETIVKTGPGVFTLAVMNWMSAAATSSATASAIAARSTFPTDGAPSPRVHETFDDKVAAAAVAVGSTTMVLPPSYFYPVPNNTTGDLIGNGREDEIRASGAGRWFREESLAAHLWAKSWQGPVAEGSEGRMGVM